MRTSRKKTPVCVCSLGFSLFFLLAHADPNSMLFPLAFSFSLLLSFQLELLVLAIFLRSFITEVFLHPLRG